MSLKLEDIVCLDTFTLMWAMKNKEYTIFADYTSEVIESFKIELSEIMSNQSNDLTALKKMFAHINEVDVVYNRGDNLYKYWILNTEDNDSITLSIRNWQLLDTILTVAVFECELLMARMEPLIKFISQIKKFLELSR